MTQETKQNKPWFQEYREFGIPETLEPYPDEPLHSLLDESAENHPEMGLVQPGVEMKYPGVKDKVDRFATALSRMGVTKGDRVATVMPTSIQFIVADYAISRAGGVNVPNDFIEAKEDLIYRLRKSEPEAIVGDEGHGDLVQELADEANVDTVILTEIAGFESGGHEDIEGVEWMSDIIAETPAEPPDIDFDADRDLHTLLFTGGTTGQPKGCMLSHKNLMANVRQMTVSQSRISDLIRGDASILNALPLYHAYGYAVLHTLIHLGVRQLLVPDPRDTDTMLEMVEEYEPLVMMGVPTQFMEMVDDLEGVDMIGISGSAPLASETQQEYSENARGITQGYGLSEMSPVTHFNVRGLLDSLMGEESTDYPFDVPTIGVPVPDTEVRLVDVDTGSEVSVEEAIRDELEVELRVRGPQRMLGYLDGDRKAFDDEGYVETGDVVKIDEMGRFYIVDRVKDMINVSGLKVYSEEVDDVLQTHPEIKRGATVGIPDPERPGSELVKVYVEGGDMLSEEDVVDYLSERVAKHAVPSEVEFIDEIPLTPIGKIDKKELRTRE